MRRTYSTPRVHGSLESRAAGAVSRDEDQDQRGRKRIREALRELDRWEHIGEFGDFSPGMFSTTPLL